VPIALQGTGTFAIFLSMPRKPKPPPDDPEQSKRFIEAAREIGTDESPEEFERVFKRVVRKPIPRRKPNQS
jgi:hypothetical protein